MHEGSALRTHPPTHPSLVVFAVVCSSVPVVEHYSAVLRTQTDKLSQVLLTLYYIFFLGGTIFNSHFYLFIYF